MVAPEKLVLKSSETEVPVWMARMASAMSLPTESCRTLRVDSRSFCGSLMVLETIISSTLEASMSSPAVPEKRACVEKPKTRRAPWSLHMLAAVVRVRAVSMRSSTMMTSQPSTSPTSVTLSPTLLQTARWGTSAENWRPSMKSLARATPPASGETMTGLTRSFMVKYVTAMGAAKRLSTGVRGPKKPWIWAQWRSTQTTRSTPMASIIRETSAAEMGTRLRSLRSWRA
mmetsp:Transcript_21963/g.68725  ORF Transcript_21963/g.68725 Transcript_21963/m.68725 type:complete len:229 (+) Transcript_21963:355-1041(+)